MANWLDTVMGQKFFMKAFEAADLPEVDEEDLEPGTYTNRQIAEKAGSPERLFTLLMAAPGHGASKRAVLSFAVDME